MLEMSRSWSCYSWVMALRMSRRGGVTVFLHSDAYIARDVLRSGCLGNEIFLCFVFTCVIATMQMMR